MLITIGRRKNSSELVELLLECHGRIRTFVALAAMAGASSDSPESEVRSACERSERYFSIALPLHIQDEEESVLPRLRGRDESVDAALATMHRQHQEHVELLSSFLEALRLVREEPSDPSRRARLHEEATRLGHAFEEHLRNEEKVIFPAVRAQLSKEEQAEIALELRRRRA